MEEKCIICGAVIPEGRQVCPMCESEAVEAFQELSLYKRGHLCLIPADIYEKQCKELDELKEKQTAKKAKSICWCTKCNSYNQAWAGRMKVAPYDTVYCWHCGQAHRLEV